MSQIEILETQLKMLDLQFQLHQHNYPLQRDRIEKMIAAEKAKAAEQASDKPKAAAKR